MALLEAGSSSQPARNFSRAIRKIAAELATCLDGLAFVHSAGGAECRGPAAAHVDEESAHGPSRWGISKLIREIGRGGNGRGVRGGCSFRWAERVAVKVAAVLRRHWDARHLQEISQ